MARICKGRVAQRQARAVNEPLDRYIPERYHVHEGTVDRFAPVPAGTSIGNRAVRSRQVSFQLKRHHPPVKF
jgi:hypothetical protein